MCTRCLLSMDWSQLPARAAWFPSTSVVVEHWNLVRIKSLHPGSYCPFLSNYFLWSICIFKCPFITLLFSDIRFIYSILCAMQWYSAACGIVQSALKMDFRGFCIMYLSLLHYYVTILLRFDFPPTPLKAICRFYLQLTTVHSSYRSSAFPRGSARKVCILHTFEISDSVLDYVLVFLSSWQI